MFFCHSWLQKTPYMSEMGFITSCSNWNIYVDMFMGSRLWQEADGKQKSKEKKKTQIKATSPGFYSGNCMCYSRVLAACKSIYIPGIVK